MSTYEAKWKGAVTTISSHIEVSVYFGSSVSFRI